jgi:putative heme-binding domain-containing protein
VKQPAAELELLHGLREGLRGHKGLKSPPGWPVVLDRLLASERPEVQEHGLSLAMLFEPESAARKLKDMVGDGSLAPARRAAALRVALEHRQVDVSPLLPALLDEPGLRSLAIRALAIHPRNDAPALLLEQYNRCSPEERQAALATLASRPAWALALLDAIEAAKVPRADLSAFTARQMGELKDDAVQQKLTKVWGQLRSSSAERKALIAKWQTTLEVGVLSQADLSNGKRVFEKTCAACHVLNGQGGKIGPDLTGSNRNDLFYLLENIIDPSAVIGRDYQLNNFLMNDGRLVSGIVVEDSPRVFVVQTATERLVLPKDEVEERKVANVSMMPEGIAEKLSFEELRDLIAFLRQK